MTAPRTGGVKHLARDVIIIFVVAVLLSVVVKTFLVRSFYIPSGSMEHTLQLQDRIVVNELVPNLVPLQRGDVVVFEDPGGWLHLPAIPPVNAVVGAVDWVLTTVGFSPVNSNDHLIKRVIGIPGDTVTCCDAAGKVEVNGVPLHEPYVALFPGVTRSSAIDFSVRVPAGSLWVMGDNRDNSRDSRYNQDTPSRGFVPMADVVGRAFVITWPVGRVGWLDNYPATFSGIGPGNK